MRIISGTAKGHRLQTLGTDKVRPTADRVRESLFNIVGPSILDAKVLDLFAGFGALGLEALSRGAQSACFIEKSKRVSQIIKANLEMLQFLNAEVLSMDVFRALSLLVRKGHKFDIIFADPPYRLFQNLWIRDLWEWNTQLLEHQGLFIVEHPSQWTSPDRISSLVHQDTRKYGQTHVSFYHSLEK